MPSRFIDVLNDLDEVILTYEETDDSVVSWTIQTIFPELDPDNAAYIGDENYTFVLRTAETAVYTTLTTVGPALTASDNLAGRDLTISVDSFTGTPTPSITLTSLTLDGADVLGTEAGSNPWVYTVPDSVSDQSVSWTIEASNSKGVDTASGSEVVLANLALPTMTASDLLSGRNLTILVDTLTGIPAPSVSLVALTLDGTDVLGSETGADPWVYIAPDSAAAQTVAWTLEATNSAGTDTVSGMSVVSGNLTGASSGNAGEIVFDPIADFGDWTAAAGSAGEIIATSTTDGTEFLYRSKSAGGGWTRATGSSPITITELNPGAVYEFIKGDGTIGEVATVASSGTTLFRETDGSVTVQQLETPWTPVLTRNPDGTITVEAA